jgi:mRNA interferase MazF
VLVISYRNKLSGAVTVVPCSTQDQANNPWAIKLTMSIDGKDSWAICDKISTFAVSRLSQAKFRIRLSEEEFNKVLAKVLEWLPALSKAPEP